MAAFAPVPAALADRAADFASEVLEQQAQGAPAYTPKWFKADEWKAYRLIANLIIPKDARSGSATDAGVPEYVDWLANDNPNGYLWLREALRWMDGFAYNTYHKSFANITDAQRRALLDQIAWPRKAKKELSEGVNFFNRLRDLTAGGFWSSKMGVQDIGYLGNVARPEWTGCPAPAMNHLGVSQDAMKTRIAPGS